MTKQAKDKHIKLCLIIPFRMVNRHRKTQSLNYEKKKRLSPRRHLNIIDLKNVK